MKRMMIWFIIFSCEIYAMVSQSTGSMVSSERLVTIGENRLNFDLNIQYAAGITINQHASWVGLGFDLSLPYVERVPMGSADEKSGSNPGCVGVNSHYSSIGLYDELLLQTSNGYSETPPEANQFLF